MTNAKVIAEVNCGNSAAIKYAVDLLLEVIAKSKLIGWNIKIEELDNGK